MDVQDKIKLQEAVAASVARNAGVSEDLGLLAAAVPILHGTSSTGLTTSLPNPAAAITAGTASIYAAAR